MKTTALVVAAGNSVRFGGTTPKQFCEIAGRPMLSWTLQRFEEASSVADVILVVAPDYLSFASAKIIDEYELRKVIKVVPGGDTRQESVRLGLQAVSAVTELVAIHDGARPLVSPADIDGVVVAAAEHKAALLAIPVPDTVKRVTGDRVVATLDRQFLYLAQTPQVFDKDLITRCHESARGQEAVTDDAALVEQTGQPVRVVRPTSPNFKVTTPDDFQLAACLMTGT